MRFIPLNKNMADKMADNVAGISNTSEASALLQPKTPTTRTAKSTASTTAKHTPTSCKRSCGLQRPSPPFVSPVMKHRFVSDSQENFNTPKRSRHDSQDQNGIPSCKQTEPTIHELLAKKKELIKMIQEREDSLRKLKLVKMYRNKNDFKELKCLIDKWRTVSQDAAERLLEKIQLDPKPTMGQLLSNLQVDMEIIHYSEEDEGFY